MTIYPLATCIVLAATAFDQTYDAAAAAYAEGDFQSAVQLFEQLISENIEDAAVFCNTGNTYYRMGRLGAAVANYERALRVSPRHPDAEHNLELCIAKTKGRLDRPLPPDWEQGVLFWHYGLAPRMIYGVTAVGWLTFWTILAIRQRKPVRYLGSVAIVIGLLTTAFGAAAWTKAHPLPLAVVDQHSVDVRYAPDDGATWRFELHEGDRVAVEMRRDGWTRVTTAAGDRGWTRDNGLVFVGPPYEKPGFDPASDKESPEMKRRKAEL
jgi:hypothetical protein